MSLWAEPHEAALPNLQLTGAKVNSFFWGKEAVWCRLFSQPFKKMVSRYDVATPNVDSREVFSMEEIVSKGF